MDKLEKGVMLLVAKELGKKVQKEVQNQCTEIKKEYKGAEKICKNFVQNQIISASKKASSRNSDASDDDDDRSLLLEKGCKKVKKSLGHIQCEYKYQSYQAKYQAEQIQGKVLKKWKSVQGHKLITGNGQQNDMEIEAEEGYSIEEKKPRRETNLFKNRKSNNNVYSSQNEEKEVALYPNSTVDQQINSAVSNSNYQYSDVYSTSLPNVDPGKTKNALKMVQMNLEKSGKIRDAQVLDQVGRDLDAIFTQNFYLVQSNETLKSQNINLLERKADLIKDIEDLQLQLDKSKSKKGINWSNCLKNLKKKTPREI